jgi:hypothetical protein
VTVDDWKQAVEHAQCLAKTAEKKASAQRVHYKRRLVTLEVESDRLRASVLVREAEKHVKLMEASNKKVRVRFN